MSHAGGVLFLLIVVSYEVASKVEFTNIVCTSLDKEFSEFEYCYLKSVNRTYKYVSVKSNLYQTPVNFSLYKRFNGYRPFMYNITVDACRFLKNPKSNPVTLFFFSSFAEFSNLNHSCPFNGALVLEKLSTEFINHQTTKVLPFPEGDYMVELNWLAYDINRSVIKFYYTLS
ncbi:uncharacterized protein LOC111078351 isoform X2 [Drosophila obscura]|uniref:uncharacterized protein LOC111078351 isoform X2 n=1 Tax=Drosophila obscura TaxID=7282 RepID=UPI001BB227AB|nr:uncharacterized protein LOC111078351 isoform X2 [Drosophila obscura]